MAKRAVSSMPISPIGTLMKKIPRQPTSAINTPPTTGPAASAVLAPAARKPTARVRCAAS
jgi:hypothetical protein